MTTTAPELAMILDEVEVMNVERLGPTFVRVELGSPSLAEFGVDGPLLDQRIKLIFPGSSGRVPRPWDGEGSEEGWWSTWIQRDADERGHMRTYTVRDVRGSGADTRLVVDLVLHVAEGATGPGGLWASRVAVGDRLVIMAPRMGHVYGGIEFDAGDASRVLIVGDETAVPAICGILRDLPADAVGAAYVEVPEAGDVQQVAAPDGVRVTWIARDGAPLGDKLTAAVVAHLGSQDAHTDVADDEVDPDLWETPAYSSATESAPEDTELGPVGSGLDDLYAWIAGESKVVTGLRRHLVSELGMPRRRVAFMGYWRRGVSMRS
jgi:NADPH-dependent ferric siderophore reductase